MCPSCTTCICALVLVPATAQNMVGEQTLRTTTPPASGCGVYGVCVHRDHVHHLDGSTTHSHLLDEIRYSVSSGGTVSSTSCIHGSTVHSSMHRTMLLLVYTVVHWCMMLVCSIPESGYPLVWYDVPGCSTRHPTRSMSGMTMRVVSTDVPASGIPSFHAHGLSPVHWCVHWCSVSI